MRPAISLNPFFDPFMGTVYVADQLVGRAKIAGRLVLARVLFLDLQQNRQRLFGTTRPNERHRQVVSSLEVGRVAVL